MAKNASVLRIRQVRSRIGQTLRQREALRTLGLRRIGQVVERPDNAAVRGTVRAIPHLVSVEGDDVAQDAPNESTSVTSPEKLNKTETAPEMLTAPKVTKQTTGKKSVRKTAAKTTKKKAKTTKKKASGGRS